MRLGANIFKGLLTAHRADNKTYFSGAVIHGYNHSAWGCSDKRIKSSRAAWAMWQARPLLIE